MRPWFVTLIALLIGCWMTFSPATLVVVQAQPSNAIPSWVFFDCSVHSNPGVYADRVRGCHGKIMQYKSHAIHLVQLLYIYLIHAYSIYTVSVSIPFQSSTSAQPAGSPSKWSAHVRIYTPPPDLFNP